MLLLALKRADRVSRVLTVQISSTSAYDAPAKLPTLNVMFILYINLDLLLYLGIVLLYLNGH